MYVVTIKTHIKTIFAYILKKSLLIHRVLFTFLFLILLGDVNAQCGSIDFTVSENFVCAPKLVRFYAKNIPAGSSIEWDYGNGPKIGKDTGQYIFTLAGIYSITLKVTLSDGVTECVVNKTNFITVYDSPIPAFSVSRNVLCNGGDTVTITDKSVGGVSRNWVIDGLPIADTSKSVVYSFNTAGYKEILLVLNSANCPTSYKKVDSAVRVYNTLDFDIAVDTNKGCAPANFTFSMLQPTGGHSFGTYSWTFTGGVPATSNLPNPVINYPNAGTYSIGLTLTNTDGCSHTVFKGNYFQLGDTVNFSVINSKNKACRNEDIDLVLSDPSLPGTFIWDLGNGTPQQGSILTHQIVKFNDTGYQYYKVSRSFNGCLSERTYTKSVFITPPNASFTILNSVECDPNARVYLFNTTKIDPSATHTYTWNFYSGNTLLGTSNDSIPIFFTNGNGAYSLELIVQSSNGCEDSLRLENSIIRSNGVGSFNAMPEISCVGGQVSFISNSPSFSSGEPNVHFWTVFDKDGVTALTSKNTGIIPSLKYSFNDTGEYNVTLIVYNSKCGDTVRRAKTVKIVKPTTNVVVSDTRPCVKTPINFTASSIPAVSTSTGYTYTWILQNPTDTAESYTSQGQNVTFTPDTPGVYNLYTITNWGVGCTDTVLQTNHVQISAPAFTIASSNYNDCIPLTANLTSNVVFNHNYKTPANTAITYNWSVTPSGGVTITAPNAANTPVTFNSKGTYTIRLIAQNGSGCRDTVFDGEKVQAGLYTDFSVSSPTVCVGNTLNVVNRSLYFPDGYQWSSNPVGVVFSPNSTVASPQIQFPDSGTFTISLVSSKRNTCFDTITTTVKAIKTIAGFTSTDTLNYCAPVTVNFNSQAINADTLIWYLGDGKRQVTPNIGTLPYIYFKNSSSSGFDVKQIAINRHGCKDSITRFGYVRIDGPVPDYSLDINKGCEPLTVTITDKSLSYSEYYFDYGDGSKFDTTGNPSAHIYTANNALTELSKYQPRLFLLDPLGCFSENIYPIEVEVYQKPQIKFMADTVQGCVPLTVHFTDSSRFVKQYQWDFENDGSVDDTARNPTYIYTSTGFKTVKLNARSQYGCRDADSLLNYIEVFNLPQAAFTFSRFDSDTANIFYDFQNQSSNFNTIEWYVDDTLLIGTSPDFRYPFKDTGYQKVKLLAISAQGCVDSTDTTLFVTPDYFFYMPNAFTPNGREGNETFGPYGPIWARKYVMRIFNRYGQKLFETNRVERQWDGTFKDVPCQPDVYLYNIEYLDIFSKWHVFNGTVMLIR